jgi:hypothetical protein
MMRALSVSALLFLSIELVAFGLLWPQANSLSLVALIVHLTASLFSAMWFAEKWHSGSDKLTLVGFIATSVFLLPIIGSVILLIIDSRQALRQYGIEAGVGTDNIKTDSPKDLLNYFSAPDQFDKVSRRKTRDLLSSLDDDAYLGLLIASRHLPDKEAYALLSEALLSPFESARLMSYSLKGKLEEKMQENLQDKLDAIPRASIKQKSELNLAVTHDYLHLLDVGVESSSKEVLLKKASEHCIKAIKLNKTNGSAYKVLSDILLLQGQSHKAQIALQRSLKLSSLSTNNLAAA